MTITQSPNLSALTAHRTILKVWRIIIVSGLLLFALALTTSYFALDNTPALASDTLKYRRTEQILGLSELGGVALSVAAYLRYLVVKKKYRRQVFAQMVMDNGWTKDQQFDRNKVAGTLLSAGDFWEQYFGFTGSVGGRDFSCLVFECMGSGSKARRYICMRYKLSKASPFILLNNKLNDHRLHYDNDLPQNLPGGVELSLEGDFSDYYQVSTTKGGEREMLEVLTPDLMAVLEDHAHEKVDVEIAGKRLFLLYEADYYSAQNLADLFMVADLVLSKLDAGRKPRLVTSKQAEAIVVREAEAVRHKLMFGVDWVGIVVSLLVTVAAMILMISHVMDTNGDPPCSMANPCHAPSFHAGY